MCPSFRRVLQAEAEMSYYNGPQYPAIVRKSFQGTNRYVYVLKVGTYNIYGLLWPSGWDIVGRSRIDKQIIKYMNLLSRPHVIVLLEHSEACKRSLDVLILIIIIMVLNIITSRPVF